MPSGRKKVKPRTPPGQPHILARETPSGSTNNETPYFSFCHLQAGFRVTDCHQAQKAEFAQRLEELSRLTWNDINQAPRQGLGTETISRTSIRRPIPDHVTLDVRILSFYFGGGARMIGYRRDRVFHVLWIDPNHKVYG
ncbi:MAG: hypothetical protein M3Q10_12250 [Chloroflexota bacterium]|nr:hypothetical protein [Chloroflexota bacterium]